MNYFRKIMRPTAYHGTNKKAPFFEGWYFKLVDAQNQHGYAVIPGIYKGKNPKDSTAFIMFLDGKRKGAHYFTYPTEQFRASATDFQTQVGGSIFSADTLTLNLPNVTGHLKFSNLTDWPITRRSPGIMGWYAYVPMECYHGIVSLDHTISGQLEIEGETIDFEGGRGYTEKDWGRNFPQTWVWIQANHFDVSGTSLTASIARIPFYGTVFPGYIIGLWHDGTLHRFTTYNGAKLEKVAIDGDHVEIVIKNKQNRLLISADRGATALLHKPTKTDGMIPAVKESVSAQVSIQLQELKGKTIYESVSQHGAMEIEGDTQILLH